MAALILPRRLTTQPQSPPTLAPRYAAWEWVMLGPFGSRNFGTGGQLASFSGAAGARAYGAAGVAYLVGQAADSAAGLQVPAPASAPTNHSGVIVFSHESPGTIQGLFDTSQTTQKFGFNLQITPSNTLEVDSRAVSLIVASPVVMPGGVNVVAWSHNATTLTVAVNGIVTSVADTTSYQWLNVSFGSVSSAQGVGPETLTHRQYLSALSVTQQLTIAELESVTLNPWQMFNAPARELWVSGSTPVSASVGKTDGADVLSAQANQTSASSAKTDGADALSAHAGAVVAASVAKTDGADTLAANAAPLVGVTSATTDGADVLAAQASLASVSASSATTDGADALAANAAPVIDSSSGTTDGADVLAAAGGVSAVNASSATTDGADSLAAAAAPVVAASSATTDGLDVLAASAALASVSASSATSDGADAVAANAAPVVGGSSATSDGADTLAANADPQVTGVSGSSSTTDGADALSAAVGPIVAASSAANDGADVLASSVGATVEGSSATTDGADVLLANVAPLGVLSASAALVEGQDALTAYIDTGTSGAGYDNGKTKKKRYQIKVDGRLIEGDKHLIEAIAADIVKKEAANADLSKPVVAKAPDIAEILVEAKRNKPALTVPAKDIQAEAKAKMEHEIRMRFEEDEEDALMALLAA